MVISAQTVLVGLAIIAFVASAFREPYRYHLIAVGFALFAGSFLIR